EQAKQLDSMLRTDEIGIADDEQGRCLDRPNGLDWPVLDFTVQVLLLGEEPVKLLWMRGNPGVFLIEGGSGQILGDRVFNACQEIGVESTAVESDGGEHQLADGIRVTDGRLQGNASSQAPAKEIRLFDPDLGGQSSDVVRQLFVA